MKNDEKYSQTYGEALDELYDEWKELRRRFLAEFEKSKLFTFIVTKIYGITLDDEEE